MLLNDVAAVIRRPAPAFQAMRDGRSLPGATAVVVGAGVVAAGLSALSSLAEPGAHDAAGFGISAVLPVLFVAVWLIDALVVDAVAQLMGAGTRLRTWASVSAVAIPVLCAFDGLRVVQGLIDRAGAVDVSTAVGFLGFGVLGWFLALITLGISAVYELPRMSAFSAALAPPAAMATLLVVFLVVGTAVARP